MRRIRIWDPDVIYHVSNRTQEAKYLFVPDDAFNELVHRWLTRAVRIFGVELYAVVIMGNHFHLIVRAPRLNLSKFMQYFQTNLSRAVNVLRGRFDASVFPRRFEAEAILDEASLERMLAYVLCNPVAANLVERPGQYPGLTSYRQSAGRGDEGLVLTVPPMWRGLGEAEVYEKFRQLVAPTIRDCARERRYRVMGPAKVRSVKWWTRPKRPKRGRRAFCHGATRQARLQYVTQANMTQTLYQIAARAWREGEIKPFPYGTIPPGWIDCNCAGRRRMPQPLRLAA